MGSVRLLAVIALCFVAALAPVRRHDVGRAAPRLGAETAAQEAESAEVPTFASGRWRVGVVAAVRSSGVNALDLAREEGQEWLVVVADVTNWGEDDGELAATDFGVRVDGEDAADAEPATATTTTDLNLRAGPSTDAEVLAVMPTGSTVTLTGEQEGDFVGVTFEGQEGWASTTGLAFDTEVPAEPEGSLATEATEGAAETLETEPRSVDAAVAIAADETTRFTLVFQIPEDAEGPALVLDAALPLDDALEADPDLGDLPEVTEPPALEEAQVDDVVDGATLRVFLPEGEQNDDIRLIGVDAPVDDDCFADESADRLAELAGETVYLETGIGGRLEGADALLRHVWVERDGNRVLLNQELVADGYAAADFEGQGDEVRFRRWLEDAQRVAEAEERGLWAECTGPHGEKKPDPTPTPRPPTPTPSAEEVRAGYPVLEDVRELAIRPGGFIGDEIAFSGTVLTIQVASPGRVFVLSDDFEYAAQAALQVTVVAPDGSTEVISVGYDGDTTGIFEGTFVTVYGTVVGTRSGTNAFGGTIVNPLVNADIVDIG